MNADPTTETEAPEGTQEAPQGPTDVAGELEALRASIAKLEAKTTAGQLTVQQTDQELADKVGELRERYADWPQAGPQSEFVDQPQPWALRDHGLPQPGVTRDHLPPGEPDQISPVVVAHRRPQLTAGTAGDDVADLAALLAKVGYPTSISEGRNHANAFDDTVTAAVNLFRRDYHVQEDPTGFRDQHEADRFVGPYVWEGLIRAAAQD